MRPHRISVSVSKELLEALKLRATKDNRSVSDTVYVILLEKLVESLEVPVT